MKAKTFLLGLIIGSLLALTVSVAAASREVQALLDDTVKITIDGKTISIPEGFAILNYEGRLYTPVRLIAEGMGGTADYNENTHTATLTKPTPEPTPEPTSTPEPEETPEPTPTPTPTPAAKEFIEAPVKLMKDDVIMKVFGLSSSRNNAFLMLDMKNDSTISAMFDMSKAYLEVDGQKFTIDPSQNFNWMNSIGPGVELENAVMIFDGDIKGAKQVSVYLPFTHQRSLVGEKDTTLGFSMNIDFE